MSAVDDDDYVAEERRLDVIEEEPSEITEMNVLKEPTGTSFSQQEHEAAVSDTQRHIQPIEGIEFADSERINFTSETDNEAFNYNPEDIAIKKKNEIILYKIEYHKAKDILYRSNSTIYCKEFFLIIENSKKGLSSFSGYFKTNPYGVIAGASLFFSTNLTPQLYQTIIHSVPEIDNRPENILRYMEYWKVRYKP